MKSKENKRGARRLKTSCLLLCAAMLLSLCLVSCNKTSGEGSSVQATSQQAPKEVTVLRLTQPIAKGDKITSAKFEEVTLDENLVWIGAISDKDKVIGKYSAIDLDEGDFLIERYLEDEKTEEKVEENLEEGSDFGYSELGYIVVSEYVKPGQTADAARTIQRLIDSNPNSTIYFPDGVYTISKPLVTPSDPYRSVSIKLSDNAVIKASDDWSGEAMIMLGGKVQVNTIYIPGSNYFLEGGTLDGNGVAPCVSIEHGRETSVRDMNLINTPLGMVVKHGANSGSSDCDIENIRIVGNGATSSVGLLIQGWDNTFTNMRISNVNIGVRVETAANLIRDVEVTYISNPRLDMMYSSSYGFFDTGNRNWYDNCRSIQFSTAFSMYSDCVYTSCVASWPEVYEGRKQTMFLCSRGWNSVARTCVADFSAEQSLCEYLVASDGGRGYIESPIFDPNAVAGERYKSYLVGAVVSPKNNKE